MSLSFCWFPVCSVGPIDFQSVRILSVFLCFCGSVSVGSSLFTLGKPFGVVLAADRDSFVFLLGGGSRGRRTVTLAIMRMRMLSGKRLDPQSVVCSVWDWQTQTFGCPGERTQLLMLNSVRRLLGMVYGRGPDTETP